MKILATNQTNYNEKLNTKSKISNANPAFGMKVILEPESLKFTLVRRKEPAIAILNELNDFTTMLNTNTENANSKLNINRIFDLAKQKLEVPKSMPVESLLTDYKTRELHVDLEAPFSRQGLNVSVYDGKKKIETFVPHEDSQPTSNGLKARYKSTIIHGLFEYAKKAIYESPVYRRYLQSYEHDLYLKSDEFKALQAKKK